MLLPVGVAAVFVGADYERATARGDPLRVFGRVHHAVESCEGNGLFLRFMEWSMLVVCVCKVEE